MSLENAINNLADAILALAAAANSADAQDKPKRGRPAKVTEPEAPAADAAAKVAARVAAVSAEAAAPMPATPSKQAEAVADAKPLSKADVQPVLIEVVKKFGKEACGAICQAHGGPNLSALDPSTYASVLAAARKQLEQPADPTE